MKKTVISAGVISFIMMGMGSALAAGMSPELKVQGQMAAPSCEVKLDNGGVFDLKKISNGLINSSKETKLAQISTGLMVDCDAETFLNFTIVDNRAGTANKSGTTYFGLGKVNGEGKLGHYTINLANASVNKKGSQVFSANSGSSSFSATSSAYVDTKKVTGWAKANNVQNSGKEFQAIMIIEPALASSADMGGSITENVMLDGSATLNFSYGI